MSYIGDSFRNLNGWLHSFSIEVFADILKREWIDEALVQTGRQSQRERKLPAAFTVWLVIAMSVFRRLSIKNVVHRLGNVLGAGSLWRNGEDPASSSSVEARDRVGAAPLHWLARRLSAWILATHGEAMKWKGLLLLALDGTTLKVPDSDENRDRIGLPGSSRGRAAFPQMRALFLVSTQLHFILQTAFAPYGWGEMALAMHLLSSIPAGTLLLLDRGFISWKFLLRLRDAQSHFLVRVRRGMKAKRVQRLGRGDHLANVRIPRQLRRQHPELSRDVLVREIVVRIHGTWFRFFTSLLDASAYPAVELVQRYRERWEEELMLDEMKTHQCGATTVNRPVIFRCETPSRVLQEAHGLVVAYNLVRAVMAKAAARRNVSPVRLSFTDSLERIRDAALLMAAASTRELPRIYDDLLDAIARCVLPKRRERRLPREVCIKMSKFRLKRKPAA